MVHKTMSEQQACPLDVADNTRNNDHKDMLTDHQITYQQTKDITFMSTHHCLICLSSEFHYPGVARPTHYLRSEAHLNGIRSLPVEADNPKALNYQTDNFPLLTGTTLCMLLRTGTRPATAVFARGSA